MQSLNDLQVKTASLLEAGSDDALILFLCEIGAMIPSDRGYILSILGDAFVYSFMHYDQIHYVALLGALARY
jgi:hypothetical protein